MVTNLNKLKFQQTIKEDIPISGIGLHTGVFSKIVIKPAPSANKFVVLDDAIRFVRTKYGDTQYIGEQFSVSEVYSYLKVVPGVLDVLKVKLVSKTTSEYSQASITLNDNLSPDGNYLIVPKNAIVEIKFPEIDIKGKVR